MGTDLANIDHRYASPAIYMSILADEQILAHVSGELLALKHCLSMLMAARFEEDGALNRQVGILRSSLGKADHQATHEFQQLMFEKADACLTEVLQIAGKYQLRV